MQIKNFNIIEQNFKKRKTKFIKWKVKPWWRELTDESEDSG
jgi:hypothetical protein